MKLLAPEVVQTSAMDCGPAALKSAVDGFGGSVSYGRLREACQTGVDGTSIDTLEELARSLGLDAEQVMIPVDHVFIEEADALPALAVTRLPNGFTHFVLLWRRVGPFIQVMDPAHGRRFVSCRRLQADLYRHTMALSRDLVEDWLASDDFVEPLRHRLERLGVSSNDEIIDRSRGWERMAALDGATRLVSSLVEAGGVARGSEAAGVLLGALARPSSIPPSQMVMQPGPTLDEVRVQGAVMVRLRGRRAPGGDQALPVEVAAALSEVPASPARTLLSLVAEDGGLSAAFIVAACVVAALVGVAEVTLLRGLLELVRPLSLSYQRVAAMITILAVSGTLLLVEVPAVHATLRMGRHLEARLRMALLRKLPRIADRYLSSRPVSDMVERSQSLHRIRELPLLALRFIRAVATLAATVLGLFWLAPHRAGLVLVISLMALVAPIISQASVVEKDFRLRTHVGSLTRFYFDALLGLVPARAHGAERAIRYEHEGILSEWLATAWSVARASLAPQALVALGGALLAILLMRDHLGANVLDLGTTLLGSYWALTLSAIGFEIALVARQYPQVRNLTLRLLEPLGAPEQHDDEPVALTPRAGGAELRLEDVTVKAGGHTVIDGMTLAARSGEELAIVGVSGAGKSSLLGLLMGWHQLASGSVRFDGEPLDAAGLRRLRAETVWIDPAVQLWNRTLIDNLYYGAGDPCTSPRTAIDLADLQRVIGKLPEGLQTPLGEGGGLLSGGEGQRVRIARGLMRSRPRLVLLDEAFRGLDRTQRLEMLRRVREFFAGATLICVTHDLEETTLFPRVVVLDGGRVVEDAPPAELLARDSCYRRLLDAERQVRSQHWDENAWRQLRLHEGKLVEGGS